MSDSVFCWKLELVLEYQRGRWIGWHARTLNPNGESHDLWVESSEVTSTNPAVRALTDWLRSEVHRIGEVEWFESH